MPIRSILSKNRAKNRLILFAETESADGRRQRHGVSSDCLFTSGKLCTISHTLYKTPEEGFMLLFEILFRFNRSYRNIVKPRWSSPFDGEKDAIKCIPSHTQNQSLLAYPMQNQVTCHNARKYNKSIGRSENKGNRIVQKRRSGPSL